jgi:hypothetical protein
MSRIPNCGDPVCRKDDPRHTGSAQPSTTFRNENSQTTGTATRTK